MYTVKLSELFLCMRKRRSESGGMLTLPAAMKIILQSESGRHAATKGKLIGVKMLFNLNCYRYTRLLSNYTESYSLYVIYEGYCT